MLPYINCNGLALIYGAAMLLILPLNWVMSVVLAGLFHELCHYFAIRLTESRVHDVSVTCSGAVMQVTSLSDMQELFCALAGPAGSILLFFSYRWIPRIALCAGVQGLFNLLPLYPLDGGRIYRILMDLWFPRWADTICRRTEYLLVLIVFVLAFWLSAGCKLGSGPIFLALLFLSRVPGGKIPCKQRKVRVQ